MKTKLNDKLIELGLNKYQIRTLLDSDLDHSLMYSTLETKDLATDLIMSITKDKVDTRVKSKVAKGEWLVTPCTGEDSFAYTTGVHTNHGVELISTSVINIRSQVAALKNIVKMLENGIKLVYDQEAMLGECSMITGQDIDQSEYLKVVIVNEGPVDYDIHPLHLNKTHCPDVNSEIIRVYIADENNVLPAAAIRHVEINA